jgi:hypothetical protein
VELLTRRCDILVPCVAERVIDAEVAAKLQCPDCGRRERPDDASYSLNETIGFSLSPTFCATPTL